MSTTSRPPHSLTVDHVIDERPISALQIRVIVLCSLVAFVDGFDLQTMALAVPTLIEVWELPAAAFGYAQSASLVGMAIGSVFLGPLGDRLGRKPVMIGGLIFMGGASLGVIFSTEPNHLVFWRTLVGIGYGTIHGNATALTAEYAPLRRRAVLMTVMGSHVALGALVAGLVAPWLIALMGWEGLFIVGAVMPVILAAALLLAPDSLQLLSARRPDDPRVAAILRRLAPDVDVRQLRAATARATPVRGSVLDLLRPPLRERTWRLWLIYGATTFLLYLLLSWLPVLLGGAGWSQADALRGIVWFQLGGIIGGVAISWLVDRGRAVGALIGCYGATAAIAVLFSLLPPIGLVWSTLIVAIGVSLSGAMFALMALGALFYPPVVRATGFGWTAAVSRLGAVAGPLAGAGVLALGLPSSRIIALLAVPAALCVLISLSLRTVLRRIETGEDAEEAARTSGARHEAPAPLAD